MKKTANFKQFFQLLKLMNGAEKEALVWQYSNTLTTSLREFYAKNPRGYLRMIADMQKIVASNAESTKKLRSGVLHRMQKLGIDTTNWQRVNAFLRDRRVAGKMLYEMSNDELHFLIVKLESMIHKHVEKQHEIERLKQCN